MPEDRGFLKAVARRIFLASKSNPQSKRVPYSGVVYDEKEVNSALEALYDSFVSGWFALAKNGKQFEGKFCKKFGFKYCVLTNSGSSANLLSIAALMHLRKLHAGDEILTPATTFPTTVNPLLLYGLRPVLIDIDLPSFTISVEKLRESSTSRTKGLMLPHLNGNASFMPEIMTVAKQKGWIVVEDCCDALGAKVAGKYAGNYGLVSSFSFYGAHHLSMGEGGAVCTNDLEIMETVRSLRDWGRAKAQESFNGRTRKLERVGKGHSVPSDYERRYTYFTQGFNLKPLDIQPAVGLSQLEKFAHFTQQRKFNYDQLFRALSKYSNSLILPRALEGVEPNWFVFPIVVRDDAKFSRKDIVNYLERKGIETRPLLAGNILRQPAYKKTFFRVGNKLENSDLVLRNGFFVGVYPGLSRSQIQIMVDAFSSFFKNRD
ncbi:MAG: DegT/DnrJ/EryC1/StrS family aminotransferase [Nitrososphaerales archaeon]